MATPSQDAIQTFVSITGASEPDAVRMLEAHGGDLNAAVNAHFGEGDGNPSAELEPGSSPIQEEAQDDKDSPPSSPGQQDIGDPPQHNENALPFDEWGGLSSEEYNEAVMLEAAMFGGNPEGTR